MYNKFDNIWQKFLLESLLTFCLVRKVLVPRTSLDDLIVKIKRCRFYDLQCSFSNNVSEFVVISEYLLHVYVTFAHLQNSTVDSMTDTWSTSVVVLRSKE